MGKSSAYSMVNVTAALDGQPVIGLWDGDDTITVEHGADVGIGIVGADGSSMFSQTTDRSARITLRVQHTSPAHRQLRQKEKRQRAGILTGFPFTFMDRGSGEGGAADRCHVMQAPSDSKGKNATVRTWVLWTGDWDPSVPNA